MKIVGSVHYAFAFRKAYKKLPRNTQNMTDRKDQLFRKNPFHPSLKIHKLHGPLGGLWSFRITWDYRILFEFVKDGAIFYDIGTHEIYR